MKWTRENKALHTCGTAASVERRSGGWGLQFNASAVREWAGRLNGELLKTAAGNVRTFASSSAAKRAVEDAAMATA